MYALIIVDVSRGELRTLSLRPNVMYGEEDPFFVVNFLKTAAKSNGRVSWLLFLIKRNRSKDLHIPGADPHGELRFDSIYYVVLVAVVFYPLFSIINFLFHNKRHICMLRLISSYC